MWQALNGWATTGFGHPNAVLTAYYIEPPLTVLRAVFGVHIALLFYVFLIGVCIAAGSASIGSAGGASLPSRVAMALIGAFNPWTYNEMTAGHLTMLLSFGATLNLIGEILRYEPRPVRMALFTALAYVQLQFFLIDSVLLLLAAAFRRTSWLPVSTAVIVAFPSAIGLIAGGHWVASTAFLRTWQITQSVPPNSAWLLTGYFASYAAHLPWYSIAGLEIFAIVSLAALPFLRRPWEIAIVALGGSAYLLSTGLRGPISGAYDAIVTHVIAAGLFRELYDLLAYLLIGYIVLFYALARRIRFASYVALAGAVLAVSGWIVTPPAYFWIDGTKINLSRVDTLPETRFALMPPFQPLTFNGSGSGVDPDAFSRPGRVESLNEYLPRYPADVALARWLEYHDEKALQALSVSLIVQRPRFSMDSIALKQTLHLRRLQTRHGLTEVRIQPLPEMSLISQPVVVSQPPSVGDGDIFFADLPSPRGRPDFSVIRASPAENRADQGWVDASLQFVANPRIAQGIGGVYTTSRERLQVSSGLGALVNVKGELRDGLGRVIAKTTNGYTWIGLWRDSATLICHGECVVVGQGFPPAAGPKRKARTIFSLLAQWKTPWLALVSLPPGGNGAVRYNATFAPGWLAVEGGSVLPHVRLDTATNGWLIGPRLDPQEITVFYWPAAMQAIAELIAVLWIIALLARGSLRWRFAWVR